MFSVKRAIFNLDEYKAVSLTLPTEPPSLAAFAVAIGSAIGATGPAPSKKTGFVQF
jgi:hypothetical protein